MHGCFTEQYLCRISCIWYKGKGQCACERVHDLVLSFPFAEKLLQKTMIKPADHAYFSVADGYLQHGMQGNQTNVIRFCQLSIQFLGRIKWSMVCEFLIYALYALGGDSQWNSPEFSTWCSHTSSGITQDLLYKAWFIQGFKKLFLASFSFKT